MTFIGSKGRALEKQNRKQTRGAKGKTVREMLNTFLWVQFKTYSRCTGCACDEAMGISFIVQWTLPHSTGDLSSWLTLSQVVNILKLKETHVSQLLTHIGV